MVRPSMSLVPEPRSRGVPPRGLMKDLLSRIATDKDDAAFRELFETYAGRVRSFMLRQGADAATADDLAQETLLTVWRKAPLYAPEKGTAAAWIFTIARNLRIDRLRRDAPWQELADGEAEAIPSDDVAADEVVAGNQSQARVRAVLADLTAEQREVVTLAYIDGLSHSQIAERLSLPLGTVKSRMRLAYAKVRAALEDLR